MPTYRFQNTKTGEEFDKFMFMSEREPFLNDNPDLKQLPSLGVVSGDPVRMGMKKPDDSFRDIIRNIKKEHRGSNVNTW